MSKTERLLVHLCHFVPMCGFPHIYDHKLGQTFSEWTPRIRCRKNGSTPKWWNWSHFGQIVSQFLYSVLLEWLKLVKQELTQRRLLSLKHVCLRKENWADAASALWFFKMPNNGAKSDSISVFDVMLVFRLNHRLPWKRRRRKRRRRRRRQWHCCIDPLPLCWEGIETDCRRIVESDSRDLTKLGNTGWNILEEPNILQLLHYDDQCLHFNVSICKHSLRNPHCAEVALFIRVWGNQQKGSCDALGLKNDVSFFLILKAQSTVLKSTLLFGFVAAWAFCARACWCQVLDKDPFQRRIKSEDFGP